MSLAAGTRLGPYEIVGPLGSGGMGEVYRATDTRLGRDVAVKILPQRLAADPAIAARFDQEARAVAALSHPNILAIHDIGQHDGVAFAVTELLEGETLRDRLEGAAAHRFPARKAVDIAIQIAQGLSAAHAKGIIHRDLKPENVFITRDGHAKILDFGLAKIQPAPGDGPGGRGPRSDDETRAAAPTDPGTVMGTTGYLSPEQAQARSVDTRSDIFSFGAVLYEMVTGIRAFKGDSAIDTLHSIVHAPPRSLADAAPGAPNELRWLLDKCLAKDPDERYQSTRDLVVDLKNIARTLDSSPTLPMTASAASAGPVPARNMKVWGIAAFVAIAALGGLASIILVSSRPTMVKHDEASSKVSIERVTSLGTVIDATISPDGKYVVYATSDNARQGLSIRQLATGSTLELVPPLTVGMWGSTFSPDGSSVYYGLFTKEEPTRAIYRVPTLGGTPRKIVSGIDCPPTFSPDGKQIAWVRADFPGRGESALMVADADGQHQRMLTTRKPPEYFAPIFFTAAAWSPDGSRIVVPMWNAALRTGTLVAHRPADGAAVPFPKYEWPSIGQASWLPDGSGLIVAAGVYPTRRINQLWLVRADRAERRQITNDFLDYRHGTATSDGAALVAVAAESTSTIWLASLDGAGDPVRVSTARQDGLNGVAALRDGRIAYRSLESGSAATVWVMNGDGSQRAQVTTEGVAAWPAAAPDGQSIVYAREGSGLWRIGVDGQGARAIAGGSGGLYPFFTPDGRSIVFTGGNAGADGIGAGETLYTLPVEGGTPRPLLDPGVTGTRASVSPDGKQVAMYYAERGGVTYLAVTPINLDGGTRPTKKFEVAPSIAYAGVRWTLDGKALLHNSAVGDRTNIWLQPLDGGAPRKVTHFSDQAIFAFDRSADGKTLIIARGTLTRDAVLIRNFR